MKYLYCPRCKELRVKAWYQRSDYCSRCNGPATAIPIPSNWMTYLTYVLYVVVPALVAIYIYTDTRYFIWLAIVGLGIMMVVSYADISRGAVYAKKKIRVTDSDVDLFRRRGWN